MTRRQRSQALLDALRSTGIAEPQSRAVLAMMSRSEPGRWLPVDALDLVQISGDGLYFTAAVKNYLRSLTAPNGDPAERVWVEHELRRLSWIVTKPSDS